MVIAMRPSERGRAEDGKLLPRLEWPYDKNYAQLAHLQTSWIDEDIDEDIGVRAASF